MTNRQFWQVMLILYGFFVPFLFGICWFTWRSIRRLRARYEAPAETADPAPASATEAAIILAGEKYDRGEFQRAVVRRIPRDLFGDDLILECGHITMAARREEDVASADCHQCAGAWIEAESRVKPQSLSRFFKNPRAAH